MQYRGSLILCVVAVIWGTAFSAQRAGMESIGPFAFNGIRFALGCVSLLPLLYYLRRQKTPEKRRSDCRAAWKAGIVTGLIMMIDLSFQQVGLVYTSAGKAAFITCLYLILVPLAGVFLRRRIAAHIWAGAVLSLAGLYFLCVTKGFVIGFGDMVMLGSAVFGAVHILAIGYYARHVDSMELAVCQFFVCAAASMLVAIGIEEIRWSFVVNAAIPILYGGFLSVGVAYTLQIYGQKYADPAHAVIIMSLESVFGAISGYLFLGEVLTMSQIGGCGLMLTGVLISQLGILYRYKFGRGDDTRCVGK